jgi:hypothetical protein
MNKKIANYISATNWILLEKFIEILKNEAP